MESTQVSVGERPDKQDVVHLRHEILSSPRKEGNSGTCYHVVNLEDIALRLPVTKDKHCSNPTSVKSAGWPIP